MTLDPAKKFTFKQRVEELMKALKRLRTKEREEELERLKEKLKE
jgi:hypothetical protein